MLQKVCILNARTWLRNILYSMIVLNHKTFYQNWAVQWLCQWHRSLKKWVGRSINWDYIFHRQVIICLCHFHTDIESIMDLQEIMPIKTMGSDQFVTDEIMELSIDELLKKWHGILLRDSPMCWWQAVRTKNLLQNIVWFLWSIDCWRKGCFVKLYHT